MYTATQGAFVIRFAFPQGGEDSPSAGDGLTIATYNAHILGDRKTSNKRGK